LISKKESSDYRDSYVETTDPEWRKSQAILHKEIRNIINLLKIPPRDSLLLPPLPKSFVPRKIDCILEIQPLELARQLTICECEHLKKISLHEYVDASQSLNITQYKQWQTSITHWLTLEIITKFKVRQRVKIIRYMTDLMKHLLDLKNFNGAMYIGTILTSSPISKLKRTMERKDIAIQKLIQSANININQYESPDPFIPPLPSILDRITNILSTPVSQNGKINWQQLQSLASVLSVIHNAHLQDYTLAPVDNIQSYILLRMEYIVPQLDYENLVNLSITADTNGKSPASDQIPMSLSKILSKYSYKS